MKVKLSRLLEISPRRASVYLKAYLHGVWRPGNSYKERTTSPAIFVLSTGRVGSKTLAEISRLASSVLAFHEPEPILFGLSKAAYLTPKDQCVDVVAEALLAARAEYFDICRTLGKGYVETSPQLTFLAPAILRLLPNAKFVHLVRHPASVVRSGMRRGWYAGHPADSSRIAPRKDAEHAAHWEQLDPFNKNLWLWAETNRWISDFLESVSDAQKMRIVSEKLFQAEPSQIEGLFEFLEDRQPPKKKIERILAKRSNAQVSGSFPRFENWDASMKGELRQYCGDIAAGFGYRI